MQRVLLIQALADALVFGTVVAVSDGVDATTPADALVAAVLVAALSAGARPWLASNDFPAAFAERAFAVFGGVILTLELLGAVALALAGLGLGRPAAGAAATAALVVVYALSRPRLRRTKASGWLTRRFAWFSSTMLALALTDGLLAGVRLDDLATLVRAASIVWAADVVVSAVAHASLRRRRGEPRAVDYGGRPRSRA